MPKRLFRLYQRKRIININVNIATAGLTAIAIGAGVVWIFKKAFPGLPTYAYTTTGLIADVIIDVGLYFALHWAANHWRPVKGRTEKEKRALEADPPPFWKDATLVQFERAILSPIFYLLSAGGMETLQRALGWHASLAMIVGFSSALVITRVIHTIWGLRSGRFRDHHEQTARAPEPGGASGSKGPSGL
ncbi:MAG: hypothetical protein AAGB51_01825 [Planctomycetota bacterium]